MKRLSVQLVLIVAFISPTSLYAWNDTGHMTVALIAYRRLDDHERQQVAALLKQHPHYKLYLNDKVPEGVNADEWAFLRGAIWPDLVRPSMPGDRLFKPASITHFHNGPWHYISIPYVLPEKSSPVNPTTLPLRPEPNAVTALEENAAKLRSKESTPEEKAVALCWLEHVVGDIHQPLHACSIYSSEYPNGDNGGNLSAIRANGNVMRLHAFWDEALGNSDAYDALDFLASQIMSEPQCDPTRLREYKEHTSFTSWADESHKYAIALAYLNGRLRSVPYNDFASKHITAEQVPDLPASYAGNARELSKLRVAMAGYRLADQIKALLKD